VSDATRPDTPAAKATLYDKRGVPIEPGDLLKSHHFRERNGRNHWLYHVAVMDCGQLRAMPVHRLEPSLSDGVGGDPVLTQRLAGAMEIIASHPAGRVRHHDERPRRKPAPEDTTHARPRT
jgi:hypothetical protein